MNKPRLIARLKADALEKTYLLCLAAVFTGVFLAVDALLDHSRSLLPFSSALISGWAIASVTNTLFSDAYDTRIKRLRAAIPPATTKTLADPDTETAR